MTDKEFLQWMYIRLVNIHGEPKFSDFMFRLQAIIKATPAEQNSLEEPSNDAKR